MDYEKAYKAVLQTATQWIKDGCTDKEKICLECVFPELRESEDEKIRKGIVETIKQCPDTFLNPKNRDEMLAYLEKQKEQDNEEGDFTIYHPLKNGKGKYECIPYSFYGSLTSFSEDKDLIDFLRTCFYTKEECNEWIEQQKEQKPILEVFGFKVGDAVRLKDGDGRKHIIKSFEEVEGIHGPNFYHVEFEDNSARDGIYPGEEYPNGYYTQMEKFEEEQKPAKFNDNDDQLIGFIFDLLNDLVWRNEWAMSKEECLERLKSLRPVKQEWSEEDEKMRERLITRLNWITYNTRTDGTSPNITFFDEIDWLKSLRPQPKVECSQEDETAIQWLKNLVTRQTKLTTMYPAECKKDLLNWLNSIPNRINRPSWRPSEEQMDSLRDTIIQTKGYSYSMYLPELYEQLKKLI